MDSNVISLDKKRNLKRLKEKEVAFKNYLKKLKHEELQYEANYIINKVKDENLSNEFLLKSALLMDELAKRIEASKMSNTVNKFSQNLKQKLQQRLDYQ